MASLNKVILIGNLGKDPEVINFDDGKTMVKFSLATTENWKSKTGEKQSETQWHNIVCFGKLAEICEKYLVKGKQIYLEGKIKTRKWKTEFRETKYMTEINMTDMKMLGKKDDNYSAPQTSSSIGEDEAPF